jgi:hypothetical protein
MGDDIAKINQDPLARCGALKTQWPLTHACEDISDEISDRACLSVGFSRPNDQKISD